MDQLLDAPVLTEAQRLELAEVLYVIEKRKAINPLEFFERMPMQERIKQSKAKIKLIFGGNRSSKTTTVAEYIQTRIKETIKKLKIWVTGETFQDSVAIQQKKMWDLTPRLNVKYGKFDDINGFTNRKLQFKNNTIATFKSFDQGRDAFQSDDIDIAWFDEEPPADIVKESRMRLIDRDGEMIISMTSLKGITDLIEDMFEGHDVIESQEVPECIWRIHHGLRGKVLPRIARKGDIDIFFLWTTENHYVNQERLLDEVKLMTEQEVLCRIFGLPINLAGKIYMSFSRDVHVISLDDVPLTGNQLTNVLDPHDRKPWAITWELVNKNGSCYQVDEYPNRNFIDMVFDDKTYEEYAEIIKLKEAAIRERFNVTGPTKRIIDPNFGNKTVQMAKRQGGQSKTTPKEELARLGLKYNDGIDALEAGHLEVRKWLHWIKRQGQLVVAPLLYICDNCHNTINHMSRYSRKDPNASDGDIKDTVQPMDKYKDFCDNKRYFVMSNPHWIEHKVFNVKAPKTY